MAEEDSVSSLSEVEEEGDQQEEDEKTANDLKRGPVGQKYKLAAEVANKVMASLVAASVAGKKVLELCEAGDRQINELLATVFTNAKLEKGVAFPTSLSVNNMVSHFSPLQGDATILNNGDMVKIDLGVHIDGYVALGAHTLVVGPAAVTGRTADVLCAAHFAAEAALRLLKPGNTNTMITDVIGKIAETFHCTPVQGVLSHQMKKWIIDAKKVIISKPQQDQKVDEFTIEEGEVYAIDIVMSTGDGKTKEQETRTTVYKRAMDQNYSLKMAASRSVLNEVDKKFATFPFTLRALDDEKKREAWYCRASQAWIGTSLSRFI